MRTQQQLIEALSARTGQDKQATAACAVALGELAQEAMMAGEDFVLPGIGKLTVKDRAARAGRNPQTGAAIQIAARRVPAFTAAHVLKGAAESGPRKSEA